MLQIDCCSNQSRVPWQPFPFFFLSVEFWLKWNQTLWLIFAAGSRPVWQRSRLTTARLRVNDRVITECICDGSNTDGFVVIGSKFRDPQHFSLWYGDMVVFRGVGSARYRREQPVHAWVFLRCSLHVVTCLHVGSTLSVFTLAEPDKGFHSLSYHVELTVLEWKSLSSSSFPPSPAPTPTATFSAL